MLFKKVKEEINQNYKDRNEGKITSIPWSLPRLSTVLPGITKKGKYINITANSKVGKSQLTDFLYVFQPIEWLMNNPYSGISLKIMYFSLEMSKNEKILSAISYKLFRDYDIIISPENIQSLFNGYILDKRILDIINSDEFQQWFAFFESCIEYYDEVRNPYGIFNTVKTYADNNGYFTTKEIDWQKEDGTTIKRTVKDQYIPNNPNEYVIIIVDHISLLSPEKGETLHSAMGRFSSEYALHIRDKFNYNIVVVQQQSAASEQQQFTAKGDTIIDKLKPSPDYLGDNKLVGRDVNLMLGLFWPARYGISSYEGWDLKKIGRNHREFSILLNRNGISSATIQMYFNGVCNYFTELPRVPEEKIYDKINYWNEITI